MYIYRVKFLMQQRAGHAHPFDVRYSRGQALIQQWAAHYNRGQHTYNRGQDMYILLRFDRAEDNICTFSLYFREQWAGWSGRNSQSQQQCTALFILLQMIKKVKSETKLVLEMVTCLADDLFLDGSTLGFSSDSVCESAKTSQVKKIQMLKSCEISL